MINFYFKSNNTGKPCGCKKNELIAKTIEKEVVSNPWKRPFER
jgi:hypothetical protein